MPRHAKPKAPPVLRQVMPAPPRIEARELVRWCAAEGASLAVPAEDVAMGLQAIADALHARRAAPHLPPPSAVLAWLDQVDATAAALSDLVADAEARVLLGDVDPEAIEALRRIRAAVPASRVQHLTRAMTATGGRPPTGATEAREELDRLARGAFAPPLTWRQARRFRRWFRERHALTKQGADCPNTGCAFAA